MPRPTLIKLASVASVAALAAGVAACSNSGSSSGTAGATATSAAASNAAASSLPTVTLMVGGIDKQIYLPYQLAQDLGFYKKYGVNVQLSTEQNGGVGAEDAMVSGQVDMAGAWYVHAIDFRPRARTWWTWCSCQGHQASAKCAPRAPASPLRRNGKARASA